MKVVIWLLIGAFSVLFVLWAPRQIRFADQPETPVDWQPKMRTWKNGVEQ